MSGGSVPYHLRSNKYVERLLFIELLQYLNRKKELRNYAYASMGGAFLQDAKLMHSKFDMKKIFSIEADPVVYERQLFNRPLSFIDCRNINSGDLINSYDEFLDEVEAENFVFWLDYASARGRQVQLRELETLIRSSSRGDVIKITMNSSLATFGSRENDESEKEYQTKVIENIDNKLGPYFPHGSGFTYKDVSPKGVSKIISLAIKSVRFGIGFELNYSRSPERLQNLLLVAMIATVVLWLLGMMARLSGQHYQYQANTITNRQVLSLMYTGLRVANDRRFRFSASLLQAAARQLHNMVDRHGEAL